MRTSLIEIEKIENWLLEKGDIQERLITEARVLSDSAWKDNAHWQSESYDLIGFYGREKLRQEIKEVERQLFYAKEHAFFQKLIHKIFRY